MRIKNGSGISTIVGGVPIFLKKDKGERIWAWRAVYRVSFTYVQKIRKLVKALTGGFGEGIKVIQVW